MRQARQARYGDRLNGLMVVLWRAGLRIHEALSLMESDLDHRRGSILVRHGKGDRRREVGMDAWAWSALAPRLAERARLPVGPLFCVIVGPTCGHRYAFDEQLKLLLIEFDDERLAESDDDIRLGHRTTVQLVAMARCA